MSYNDKPDLAKKQLDQLKMPTFEMDAAYIERSMKFELPTMAVENLDSIPKALSQQYVGIPKPIRHRGIKRVETTVELLIDHNGRPFIKRIIDSVYPEMEEPIRQWVAKARFDIPRKNGRPVQAIYLYSINFNQG